MFCATTGHRGGCVSDAREWVLGVVSVLLLYGYIMYHTWGGVSWNEQMPPNWQQVNNTNVQKPFISSIYLHD